MRVVSIITAPSRRRVKKNGALATFYVCAILEARPRAKDGVYTWRVINTEGKIYWSIEGPTRTGNLMRCAYKMASREGLPLKLGLTRNGIEGLSGIELISEIECES